MYTQNKFAFSSNQKGAVPVLVLIGVISLIAFLAITSVAPFQKDLLSSLFPKNKSFAASAATVNITNTPSGTITTQLSTNTVYCLAGDD
jgi:hypothetical protein